MKSDIQNAQKTQISGMEGGWGEKDLSEKKLIIKEHTSVL